MLYLAFPELPWVQSLEAAPQTEHSNQTPGTTPTF